MGFNSEFKRLMITERLHENLVELGL